MTRDTDDFNFDVTGNGWPGENNVHLGVLIAIAYESTLLDPIYVVRTRQSSDAGEPLKGGGPSQSGHSGAQRAHINEAQT